MTGNKIEKSKKKVETIGLKQPGSILLNKNDLQELSLRCVAARLMHLPQQKFADGALSFPRSFLAERDIAQTLIKPLVETGRARVVNRIPKGGFSSSGNTVVYIEDDRSVRTSHADISDDILQHVTQFYLKHPDEVEAANIFPNTSTNGLKGLSIELKQTKRIGQTITDMHWSLGRGLRIIALPNSFDVEAFIDMSDFILATAYQIGSNMGGAVKSIQFLCDDNYRVYMSIAAGPTYVEKRAINQEIAKIQKPSDLIGEMSDIKERGIKVREGLSYSLMNFFPFINDSEVEMVLDSPYVFLDTDTMTAFSGGVMSNSSNLAPFSVGLSQMFIHKPKSSLIIPMGTKIQESNHPDIEIPAGVRSKKLQILNGFIPQDEITLLSTLNKVAALEVLATGFHEKMKIEK